MLVFSFCAKENDCEDCCKPSPPSLSEEGSCCLCCNDCEECRRECCKDLSGGCGGAGCTGSDGIIVCIILICSLLLIIFAIIFFFTMGLKKSAARIFGLICLILLDIVIFSLGFLDGRKNGMNSYSFSNRNINCLRYIELNSDNFNNNRFMP